MQNNTKKQPYQAPKVSDVGTVVERTLGHTTGTHLDQTFPNGTPQPDLLFS